MKKLLLLGDEAIALAAINSGLSAVYAYPGTPSTEITEYIQQNPLAKELSIHSRWCSNEKTAMEAALGLSYAGKRALVCMKHVGLNVAADAFVNSAITGVNGGLVLCVADDPGMHSSQNEQDSRFYGKFALVPIFEPCNQQEAYDMMSTAFQTSERLKLPVIVRMVTRLAHSRSVVEVGERRQQNTLNPDNDRRWILLPANARKQYNSLIAKQNLLLSDSDSSKFNSIEYIAAEQAPKSDNSSENKRIAVVACGIAYNYVKELNPQNISAILKICQYPLPEARISELAATSSEILIVEDGQTFVEQEIKALVGSYCSIRGRLTGDLPRTGELNPDLVAKALGLAEIKTFDSVESVASRPPALCPGCGHRDVYAALNKVAAEYEGARIFGDIGCYTLGALPPFSSIASCVDMGASITMAKGAADAGVWPSIAVIGDSTFTHSGMTGLLDAVNEQANITVIISDNLTTAMTGGQDSAGTNKFEAICLGLGVEPEHLRVVVPLPQNMEDITRIIREEIEYRGVSVIIPRRECIQTYRRRHKQAK